MTTSSRFRLPSNVRPIRYNITLRPNLDTFTFTGEESIELHILEPVSEIVLNAAELQVPTATLELPSGEILDGNEIDLDKETDRLTLRFLEKAPVGKSILRLSFTGSLNDQLRGFYRSQYTDARGRTQYLATTQFEATDARRALPCWDEPSIKAEFDVTLIVPKNLTAISNMPISNEEPMSGGKKAVHFETTPRMSTYLLAFIVGDLECVEETAPGGTQVRVWATRGKAHLGRFALKNSVRALAYMNNYFGIAYPLPKMDHIAIPDFAAGAMENWGAITYRETALLYDPDNSSAQIKQRILEVVAHEMAHMWFGDLVTMEWWDDLWLNESFASWMGDKTVDHLFPEWQMWTQFVSHDTNVALSLDGLRNSHPIEAVVDDPSEIRELFDAISYSKGGSVLRMLENYVGSETFQAGLHNYLSTHAYDNARGAHLWGAINDVAERNISSETRVSVSDLMEAWIKQVGYPMVKTDVKRSGSSVEVTVSQSRFLYDHLLDAKTDGSLWPIPISHTHAGSTVQTKMMLQGPRGHFRADVDKGWLKLNAGQTGFFRVAYNESEWDRLKKAITTQSLAPIDRLGLQDDAYALVKAGHMPATVFLSLAEAFLGETDAIVWGDLAANLRGLEAMLVGTPHLSAFHGYARGLFTRIAGNVGWDAQPDEEHLDAILRSVVIGSYGSYGDSDTLDEGYRRFDAHASGVKIIPPDIRGVAFSLVSQIADRTTYDTLWRLEKEAVLHEEKVRILGALTRTHDKALLSDLLERSMTDDVRAQDTPLVIVQAANNTEGRDLTWEFVKENWHELDRRYGQGGFAIMRIVGIAAGFSSLEREEEVRKFFETHPAPSAARTLQQVLESIRLNKRWLDLNLDSVGSWLAERAP
jgi:puromycin-sensitive aminopeptidase